MHRIFHEDDLLWRSIGRRWTVANELERIPEERAYRIWLAQCRALTVASTGSVVREAMRDAGMRMRGDDRGGF